MVQLFFNETQRQMFQTLVKGLSARYGTTDTTATTLEAVRRVHASLFRSA
jgi:hypothetical protein